MKDSNKVLTGVWLDSNVAHIISLTGSSEEIKSIKSQIDHGHIHGGARSSTPYGPQDAVSESKMTNRKKQQFEKYYQNIIGLIKNSDAVYILGPSTSKIGLQKAMQNKQELAKKIMGVETSDSITINQIRAKVRKFYSTAEI